jgi:hypothetical protein
LKQSSPQSAAAAAPARYSPAAGGEAGDQFKGAEKRRSPRYKCEGSAELREEGCDVRTWATFSDISLHGCYVEAQATYPANTQLHMKLDANGVRVETKGSVCVSYPYLGMGIAVDMSEENVARLRTLLATVSALSSSDPAWLLPFRPAVLRTTASLTDPAAMVALSEFFESRQMLMREDRPHRPPKSDPTARNERFRPVARGLPSIRAA